MDSFINFVTMVIVVCVCCGCEAGRGLIGSVGREVHGGSISVGVCRERVLGCRSLRGRALRSCQGRVKRLRKGVSILRSRGGTLSLHLARGGRSVPRDRTSSLCTVCVRTLRVLVVLEKGGVRGASNGGLLLSTS